MNTPSPLVPQGTLPVKGKSSFFLKVLMILTVHVVVIGGMLLQGCKDTKDVSSTSPTDSTVSTTLAPTPDTLPPLNSTSSNTVATPTPTPTPTIPTTPATMPGQQPITATPTPVAPPIATPVTPPAATESKEYVIASGDTLGAIAHKNGLSLKALLDANAGVNPKKLQVGQKIQIPASATATATATATTPDATGATGDTTVYTVKSGDTLGKIARAHSTSFKKIMALNDMKTTSIKVGQKLKLPAAKASGFEAAPAPTAAAPVVPLATPPATTTTAATTTGTVAN